MLPPRTISHYAIVYKEVLVRNHKARLVSCPSETIACRASQPALTISPQVLPASGPPDCRKQLPNDNAERMAQVRRVAGRERLPSLDSAAALNSGCPIPAFPVIMPERLHAPRNDCLPSKTAHPGDITASPAWPRPTDRGQEREPYTRACMRQSPLFIDDLLKNFSNLGF